MASTSRARRHAASARSLGYRVSRNPERRRLLCVLVDRVLRRAPLEQWRQQYLEACRQRSEPIHGRWSAAGTPGRSDHAPRASGLRSADEQGAQVSTGVRAVARTRSPMENAHAGLSRFLLHGRGYRPSGGGVLRSLPTFVRTRDNLAAPRLHLGGLSGPRERESLEPRLGLRRLGSRDSQRRRLAPLYGRSARDTRSASAGWHPDRPLQQGAARRLPLDTGTVPHRQKD